MYHMRVNDRWDVLMWMRSGRVRGGASAFASLRAAARRFCSCSTRTAPMGRPAGWEAGESLDTTLCTFFMLMCALYFSKSMRCSSVNFPPGTVPGGGAPVLEPARSGRTQLSEGCSSSHLRNSSRVSRPSPSLSPSRMAERTRSSSRAALPAISDSRYGEMSTGSRPAVAAPLLREAWRSTRATLAACRNCRFRPRRSSSSVT
mmetsp:Transcript_2701/g.6533  ORF Transcript_2701/g.6533 Transcript_2701/m.6533 type:complete len:203 (+) Transcript_2701:1497-2105(+)